MTSRSSGIPCCWISSQKPSGSEGLAEPLRALPGLLVLALPEVERHLARETGRQADDPLGVGGEHLPVDPGPAVEPLGEADRGEPDQVLVAGAIPGQQDEMAVRSGGPLGLLPGGPGAEREVRLEARGSGRICCALACS